MPKKTIEKLIDRAGYKHTALRKKTAPIRETCKQFRMFCDGKNALFCCRFLIGLLKN